MIYFFLFLFVAILLLIYYVVRAVIWLCKQKPCDDVQSFEESNLKRLLPFYFKTKELNTEINSETVDISRKAECSHEIITLYDALWVLCAESEDGRQWFSTRAIEPCHQAQESLAYYSGLWAKLQEFHRSFFPIVSSDEKIQSDWEIIPCNHNSYEQLVRQKRSIRTVPIYIDHKFLSGDFLSSTADTVYSVSLFSCDCPDFQKRYLPCKHMYRLFYELTVGTDISSSLTTPNIQESGFYRLSNSEKSDLIKLVQSLIICPDTTKTVLKSSQISRFVSLDLIQPTDSISDEDYSLLLDLMTKDEILISLRDYGIENCRSSWSKKKVVDWVVMSHRDFLFQKFNHYMAITIPSTLTAWYSYIVKAISAVHSPDTDFIKNWDAAFDEFI